MATSQAIVPVPVQTVVPVPNNVVINQQQPYPHTDMEELTPIPIPLPPEDSGQPPVKKGRESTGKWKGYDSKRVFKKEWEDRYGKCYGLRCWRDRCLFGTGCHYGGRSGFRATPRTPIFKVTLKLRQMKKLIVGI